MHDARDSIAMHSSVHSPVTTAADAGIMNTANLEREVSVAGTEAHAEKMNVPVVLRATETPAHAHA